MARKKLTDRKKLFVKEYQKDLDQQAAAVRAGYSPKTKRTKACQLMAEPAVKAAVQEDLAKTFAKLDITNERIILEYKRMAFSDLGDAYGEDGRLLSIRQMPDDIRKCVAGVDIGETVKIKLHDKKGALDFLAKAAKIIAPDTQVNFNLSLEDLIGASIEEEIGES